MKYRKKQIDVEAFQVKKGEKLPEWFQATYDPIK